MRKAIFKKASIALAALLLASGSNFAGNYDRAGQAGATELLINPWARSSGYGGANSAAVRGLEAQFLNVGGLAFTKRTEMLFSRTSWLVGTDINISSFGFFHKVGSTGFMGLGIMSMNFGDIPITTVDLPEGGIGTFSPQFINLGLAYSKAFSDNIYGGMNLKVISESISDVSARGVALDAGIQYVTGKYDHIKFGIALKNVGPRMVFNGDGLSFKAPLPNGFNGSITVEQRSAPFELPSLVNIGGSYDLYFSKDTANMKNHRVSISGTFTSNSFSKDEFRVGAEYAWKSLVMARLGYIYEEGIFNIETRTTAFTGLNAGVTVELPFGKSGSTFGLDYSYRQTNFFGGCHAIGARINL